MKIICLRTGRTIEKNLSISEASNAMIERLKTTCQQEKWTQENTEKLIKNYQMYSKNPFMFEVRA